MKPCTPVPRFQIFWHKFFRRLAVTGAIFCGECCLGQVGAPESKPLTVPNWKHEVLQRSSRSEPGVRGAIASSWKVSVVAVLAAQTADSASSWGAIELNPILAPQRGQRFDGRAAGIKFGITGALLFTEYVLLRRNPNRSKAFTKLNWGLAGVTSAIAARNLAVR
jgi:hypothetical protein